MRYILTIHFLISAAYGQHYFVVPTMSNPEGKALNVSRKFYRLAQIDTNTVTQYLFSFTKHPVSDSVALVIDTTTVIPRGSLTAAEITSFITELYGSVTTTQRNNLTTYINSNTMIRVSRLIITSRVKLWTKAEMEARGWFNYPNLIQ